MITVITGPKKSGKTTLANSLRNAHIGAGGPRLDDEHVPTGMLLVDEDTKGEPRHLLEKLIHGLALPADGTPVSAKDIPWKLKPSVVVVGDDAILDTFEELVPGFMAVCGPVTRLKLDG